uniref:Uncharacterized protein n=1 Tax=Arundo donax TaxID=35708 RepID=A0A0A8XVZ0_ARUDO
MRFTPTVLVHWDFFFMHAFVRLCDLLFPYRFNSRSYGLLHMILFL